MRCTITRLIHPILEVREEWEAMHPNPSRTALWNGSMERLYGTALWNRRCEIERAMRTCIMLGVDYPTLWDVELTS